MQDKRQLILRATEKIIAYNGIHGLSMQSVATEANVATGTIYRYFKDKDELLIELSKDVLQQLAEFLFQHDPQAPLEQQLKFIWMQLYKWGLQKSPASLSFEQYSHLPSLHYEEMSQFEMATFQPLIDIFEAGKGQGLFHSIDNRALYAMSLEPAFCLARCIRRGHEEYSAKELTHVRDLCWQNILITSSNLKEQSGA